MSALSHGILPQVELPDLEEAEEAAAGEATEPSAQEEPAADASEQPAALDSTGEEQAEPMSPHDWERKAHEDIDAPPPVAEANSAKASIVFHCSIREPSIREPLTAVAGK